MITRWPSRSVTGAREEGLELGAVPEEAETLVGRGIHAVHSGRRLAVDNQLMMREMARDLVPADALSADAVDDSLFNQAIAADDLPSRGRTQMIVTLDERPLGVSVWPTRFARMRRPRSRPCTARALRRS